MIVGVIGNGFIGQHIQKVLKGLNIAFDVYSGRGKEGTNHISTFPLRHYDAIFVAVPIEKHKEILELCYNIGVPVYIEKPGLLSDETIEYKENFYVGYNRRFYKPVTKLKEKVSAENIDVFHFDFSELVSRTDFTAYDENVVKNWFLANSIHILDSVEFIFGQFDDIAVHEIPSQKYRQFIGSGVTKTGKYFTFRSVSEHYSRWGICATSREKHYTLCPIEKLAEKNIFSGDLLELASESGEEFKEGYYEMIKAFCQEDYTDFSTLREAHETNKRLFSIFGEFIK